MSTSLISTDPVCAGGNANYTPGAVTALQKITERVKKEKKELEIAYYNRIRKQVEIEEEKIEAKEQKSVCSIHID